MAGLVEEIQAQALDSTVKISDLLRRVNLAAVKLKLDDAVQWVDRELKGYGDDDEIPSYRQTKGQLRAHTVYHGIQPVTGDANWIEDVCKRPIFDSISRVESLAGDGSQSIIANVGGYIENLMNKSNGTPGTEYYVHIPQNVFLNVLDQVRNLLLDWAIELEKAGILGEGISFTVEEQKKAAEAAPSINIENFTGHLHQGDVTGHQNRTVVASTDNSVNSLEINETFDQLIQAVDSSIGNENDREAILDLVRAMQAAQGTPEYKPLFQRWVGYVAEYATILGPFVPALSNLGG